MHSYFIVRIFTVLCVLLGLQVNTVFANELGDLPKRPHLLIDLDTGDVLSQELAFAKWAPASLTKMMTAYTIFRALELKHLDMKSPVRISEAAIIQPPSKMGFPIGTILNIETALKIIMVKSANDVSVALAEAISGSEAQFVALMNSHARRLGMVDTQFVNSHGLHDPSQYTSARDVVLLVQKLTYEFPQYASFFDIPAIRFGRTRLRNHNALLRLFDGTTGMKTGYVCASGFNIAVRTKRDGRSLVAVVMGGKSGLSRNITAARLLKSGFDNAFTPIQKFSNLKDTNVNPSEPYDITKEICTTKYSAAGAPIVRPLNAPKANEFDKIDTRIIVPENGLEVTSLDERIVPNPIKRPDYKAAIEVAKDVPFIAEIKPSLEDDEKEQKPFSLRDLSALYLKPVANLRENVVIELGNGVGLNPHGIKHTNGGVYIAPIPVPIKRPALDLTSAKE